MSKHQTDKFKELQSKWYAKLKRSGFDDIEKSEDALHTYDKRYFNKTYDLPRFLAKQEYYRLAGQFLHEYKDFTPFERKVWELHAEGMSIFDIVSVIRKKQKTSRDSVHSVIKKFRKEMVKVWNEAL